MLLGVRGRTVRPAEHKDPARVSAVADLEQLPIDKRGGGRSREQSVCRHRRRCVTDGPDPSEDQGTGRGRW
jgi:hypothetical protein